jgi:hypothetical protein
MADEKLTQIRVSAAFQTPLDGDDLFYVTQDTGTSPEGRAITGTELLAELGVTDGDKGDITKAGDTWTIENNAVTFAKMQAITDGKLLGASGGTAVEEITVGSGLALSSNTLSTTGGDFLATLSGAEISITTATALTIGRMHVISGSTDFTPTLPAASGNTGKFIGARFTNTGVTTIDGNGSETIDGVTTRKYYQGQSAVWMCDGSNWHTINGIMANRSQAVSAFQIKHSSTPAYIFNTSQPYGFAVYQNPRADGDYFEFSIYLTKGTYTLAHIGYTAPNMTKLDWTINGVSATTGVDWYSASAVYSVIKTFSLTVPYTGYHRIRATVNGRNASATDWYYNISQIAVYPAAY